MCIVVAYSKCKIMQKDNAQLNLQQGKNMNTSSFCGSAMPREAVVPAKGWAFSKEVKYCKYKFSNRMW